jgi:uncharacterized membrane protein YeaQ/YmgE (transglycosylase-associated protein family)
MIGIAGLLGWVIVGVIVATIDERSTDGGENTFIGAVGAVAGAFVGRTFGLYVAFGEIAGFVCAAAGAKLLLTLYRSQTVTVRTPRSAPSPEPVLPEPLPAPEPEREQSTAMLVAAAFGWAITCAFAAAVLGFIGHLLGGRIYPERYQQIPSDFFLVPLGMLVGFIAGGIGRLAAPNWSFGGMFGLVALVSLGYGGAMFQYSRDNATPAKFSVFVDRSPLDAVSCERDCNALDPPLQWTVLLPLRMVETSGLGGTVDSIELTSSADSSEPEKPQPYSKARAAEASRWRGPSITLTGRQVPGPRHIKPNEEAIYQIPYSYRSPDHSPGRRVSLNVSITDGAGRKTFTYAAWNVR